MPIASHFPEIDRPAIRVRNAFDPSETARKERERLAEVRWQEELKRAEERAAEMVAEMGVGR